MDVINVDSIPSDSEQNEGIDYNLAGNTPSPEGISGLQAAEEPTADASAAPLLQNGAGITNDERTHRKLRQQIETLRKKYKKKKTVLTDDNASTRMLDLEAISQYNDLQLKLLKEQKSLRSRLKNSPRVTQHRLRKRISSISPSMDASLSVARRLGKGSYFARVLRSMTNELFRTGRLPESRQGKGATHKSHLLNPRITSALRNWVKGLLPFDEGGFEGLVRFIAHKF